MISPSAMAAKTTRRRRPASCSATALPRIRRLAPWGAPRSTGRACRAGRWWGRTGEYSLLDERLEVAGAVHAELFCSGAKTSSVSPTCSRRWSGVQLRTHVVFAGALSGLSGLCLAGHLGPPQPTRTRSREWDGALWRPDHEPLIQPAASRRPEAGQPRGRRVPPQAPGAAARTSSSGAAGGRGTERPARPPRSRRERRLRSPLHR